LTDTVSQLQQQLDVLASALIRYRLWSKCPPSDKQLQSREPFCVDTMKFESWLQWVFIPNMRDMLNMPHFNGMAHASNIHAMAEHCFADRMNSLTSIIDCLKAIDGLINSFSIQPLH